MYFNKVHHIAIICSDYSKSKHFYTQILGLKVLHETYRHDRQSYKLDLELSDGMQIELFSFKNPPSRVSRPEACGLRHIAFSVIDINTAVNYLDNYGIICEDIRIDEITGKKFTFFNDPDNLPIELYEI